MYFRKFSNFPFPHRPPWQPAGRGRGWGSRCPPRPPTCAPQKQAPHRTSTARARVRAASSLRRRAGSGSRGPATDQGNHFLTFSRPSHRPGVGPGSTVLKHTPILHNSLTDLVAFTKSLFCLDWSKEILLFVVRGSSHPETRNVASETSCPQFLERQQLAPQASGNTFYDHKGEYLSGRPRGGAPDSPGPECLRLQKHLNVKMCWR